jgi:hypothetical protein
MDTMIDIIAMFFAGFIVGGITVYFYDKKRAWKMDEIIDILDKIKDNPHVQNHLGPIVNQVIQFIKEKESELFTVGGLKFLSKFNNTKVLKEFKVEFKEVK